MDELEEYINNTFNPDDIDVHSDGIDFSKDGDVYHMVSNDSGVTGYFPDGGEVTTDNLDFMKMIMDKYNGKEK